jgi:hypothetical protein
MHHPVGCSTLLVILSLRRIVLRHCSGRHGIFADADPSLALKMTTPVEERLTAYSYWYAKANLSF